MFFVTFEPQEMAELVRNYAAAFGLFSTQRYWSIIPTTPRGNATLYVPHPSMLQLVLDFADIKQPIQFIEQTPEFVKTFGIEINMSVNESNALWSKLSSDWSSFSPHFLDNSWHWMGYPHMGGASLNVRGDAWESLNGLMRKLHGYFPHMEIEKRDYSSM